MRTRSRVVMAALVLGSMAAGFAVVAPSPESASAASGPPAGFSVSTVFSGLLKPTAMAFSPDGRVFVAEKSGIIRVYPSASNSPGVVFADLRPRVYDYADRGLLGLTVDPRLGNGSGHDFVYALYARDAPPGQVPPVWNDNCPANPGENTDGCVVAGTLSRIPVNADGTAGAEQILIDDEWCQQFSTHSIGHLAFGPDGWLYVSAGEGADYGSADWGQFGGRLPNSPTPANPCGDPPGRVGVANTAPTGRGGALRSQSPRRPAGEPRLLSGTILRIDPDTGAGVPGNPLYTAGAPTSNASRILAYGMRQPYRFTMRPGTNELWVGDVGQFSTEEINRIPTLTPARALNLGWPCYEGRTRLAGFTGMDMCTSLYADTVDPAVEPYYDFAHGAPLSANDTCSSANGSSITGTAFYTGGAYPAAYRNALFFADATRGCLYVMSAGANGLPDPATVRTFVDGGDVTVDIEVDPISKDLFYVNFWQGTVKRISYTSTNQAPAAQATASPTSGVAPLAVTLDATGSTDPDGDTLSYSWDTDGNGTFGDATGARPTVTYANGGTFNPRVLVTDPGGLTDISPAVNVTVTTPTGPQNTALPSITGDLQVGATLTATTGTWTGTAPITYTHQWQRCVSGSCSDIADAISTTYAPQLADQATSLRVRVSATNGQGTSVATSAPVGPIAAGVNTPPVPVIDTPETTTAWSAGETIAFSGGATDAQDGNVPASRLSWDIALGHCSDTGCHRHPVATRAGVATGTIAAPGHEAPSFLELTLTATDAAGATASTVRRIDPRVVNLTFQSTPTGLTLSAGETAAATTFTRSWVANTQIQVTAPTTQNLGNTTYTFAGWSDGGAASHTLNVPTVDTTYTATYTAPAGPQVLLTDTWPGANGSRWADAWTTGVSAGTVDTQSGAGRLRFDKTRGAYARAQLTGLDARGDADVRFSYRFDATGSQAYFYVILRGSGGWGSSYWPANGYGLQFSSSTTNVIVVRATNGSQALLANVADGQRLTTAKQWARFRVSGNTIQFRTWPDGQTEPTSWRSTVTDPAVTGPGQLFLSIAPGSTRSRVRQVLIDDLTVRSAP